MDTIVITTSSFGEYDAQVLQPCRDRGYRIVLNPYKRTVKQDEFLSLCEDAVGIIAGTEKITGEMIAALPALRVISRCGIGMDSVDLPAAQARGIRVFNTPDAVTAAVAELTLGLILGILRKIPHMHADMRAGIWKKIMGNQLAGKNVGIIGFGRIGRAVARLLQPFGCQIAWFDPGIDDTCRDFKSLPKDDLLSWADIVSLHVSTSETLLGKTEFKRLKRTCRIVNVSRGGVVDEEALFDFLKDNPSSGAALDVFTQEPYAGPLASLPNVILTPHIGSYAAESRIIMEQESVNNLLMGLST